jgi:hypothetical protein
MKQLLKVSAEALLMWLIGIELMMCLSQIADYAL